MTQFRTILLTSGLVALYRRRSRRDDRTAIEARGPLHERDAGLPVAREDRVRDRRCAAPARQQGGVDIHRPAVDTVDQPARDEIAIRGPHQGVRPQPEDRRDRVAVQGIR